MSKIKNPKSNVRVTEELRLAQVATRVAELYTRGRTQASIAAELGCSQTTVSRAVAKLHAEWKEARLADLDAMKERELAALREIERQAWEEWERSKRDAIETHAERAEEAGRTHPKTGEPLPVRVRERSARSEKGQTGDPRLLQALLDVREKIARLYGLNAPAKLEPTLPKDAAKGTGVLLVGAIVANVDEWQKQAAPAQALLPGAQ